MKRALIFISILIMAASCLGYYENSYSGTVNATFDYGYNIFDKDSLYFDKSGSALCCLSNYPNDYLAFYHKVDKETAEFKGGFLVSCLTIPKSGVTDGLANNMYRLNAVVEWGQEKFAVFCQTDSMPEKHMEFWCSAVSINSVCTMESVWVNNALAVAEALAASEAAEYKVTLRARGYKAGTGAMTGEAAILLAEKNAEKDSVVSSWTRFDLSKLGSIDYVQFSIETLPADLNVPKVVCMDDMVANAVII